MAKKKWIIKLKRLFAQLSALPAGAVSTYASLEIIRKLMGYEHGFWNRNNLGIKYFIILVLIVIGSYSIGMIIWCRLLVFIGVLSKSDENPFSKAWNAEDPMYTEDPMIDSNLGIYPQKKLYKFIESLIHYIILPLLICGIFMVIFTVLFNEIIIPTRKLCDIFLLSIGVKSPEFSKRTAILINLCVFW